MYIENENRIEFDSLYAVGKYINSTDRNHGSGSESLSRARDWHRNMSYNDMLAVIFERGGYWEEGAKALVEAKTESDAMMQKVESESFKRDFAGSRPSVPAFLAGSPKSMIAAKKDSQFKPVMRVLVNMAFGHAVDQNYVVNRGAALLSAIASVESKGIQVELDCCMTVKCENFIRDYRVSIKKAHEALSIGDASFSLVHPNMTRRLMLALMERDDKQAVKNETCGMYGSPCNPKGATSEKAPDYDLYFSQVTNSEDLKTPALAFLSIMEKFDSKTEEV